MWFYINGNESVELNPKVTLEVVEDAANRERFGLDNPGFCVVCGVEADGCEPDAQQYPCESCGARAVYGAEEILLNLVA